MNEQVIFATKLRELTDRYGQLVNQLSTADSDAQFAESAMAEMQVVLKEMDDLRDSYIQKGEVE